jgi:hypothetical protein
MEKKFCFSLLCSLLSVTLLNAETGADDAFISFSTKGPDRYADGSIVRDGESYALVWSKDGNFDGFTASFEPIDANDKIVLSGALAKDGRCPNVLFQVPAKMAQELAAGVYGVYLLDTRCVFKDGTTGLNAPSAASSGTVNGYGSVSAQVYSTSLDKVFNGEASIASSPAVAPSSLKQPRIKAMEIRGENVFLTVENLKGFMRVSGGKNIKSPDYVGAAEETDGGENDVILVAPKTGDKGFFSVIRN